MSSPTPSNWSTCANPPISKRLSKEQRLLNDLIQMKKENELLKQLLDLKKDEEKKLKEESKVLEKELTKQVTIHTINYNWKNLAKLLQDNKQTLQYAYNWKDPNYGYDQARQITMEIDDIINNQVLSESEIFEKLLTKLDHIEMYKIGSQFSHGTTYYGNLTFLELIKQMILNYEGYKQQMSKDNDIAKIMETADYLRKCQLANEDKFRVLAEMITELQKKTETTITEEKTLDS